MFSLAPLGIQSRLALLSLLLLLTTAVLAVTTNEPRGALGSGSGIDRELALGRRVPDKRQQTERSYIYKQTSRDTITRRTRLRAKAELMSRDKQERERHHAQGEGTEGVLVTRTRARRQEPEPSPEVRSYPACTSVSGVAGYTTTGPYARYGQAVARGVNGYSTSNQGALGKQTCFTRCDTNSACRGISWAPQTSGNGTPICYHILDERWAAGAPSASQDYFATEFAIKGTCNELRPFVGTYDSRCCENPA